MWLSKHREHQITVVNKKEAENIGDGIEEEIPEPFFPGFRPAATMPSQVALFPSLLRALSNLFDFSVSDCKIIKSKIVNTVIHQIEMELLFSKTCVLFFFNPNLLCTWAHILDTTLPRVETSMLWNAREGQINVGKYTLTYKHYKYLLIWGTILSSNHSLTSSCCACVDQGIVPRIQAL